MYDEREEQINRFFFKDLAILNIFQDRFWDEKQVIFLFVLFSGNNIQQKWMWTLHSQKAYFDSLYIAVSKYQNLLAGWDLIKVDNMSPLMSCKIGSLIMFPKHII